MAGDGNPGQTEGVSVLIISGSHGQPPTQARLSRAIEIARELSRRGALVDWLLLVERPLERFEETRLHDLQGVVRGLRVVEHPIIGSPFRQLLSLLAEAVRSRRGSSGGLDAPRALLKLVSGQLACCGYDAAIACGAHLARALEPLQPESLRILDVPRLGCGQRWVEGSPDPSERPGDCERETRTLSKADVLLVGCAEDAVALRTRGFNGELIPVPPAAWQGGKPPTRTVLEPSGTENPPRILFVGSETEANVDAVRWLRRRVLPLVRDLVPAARLRVVGEVSRHLEPSADVDRMGWVEDIHREYAGACAVVLPLRFGSGLHRRAVEAIGHGKVLCATTVGALGTGATHDRESIVADDSRILASGIARVLASEDRRREMEESALRLASGRFGPGRSFGALAHLLALPKVVPEESADAELREVPAATAATP